MANNITIGIAPDIDANVAWHLNEPPDVKHFNTPNP